MNQSATTGVMLALGLILFGAFTVYLQRRGKRRLAERKHVPSDEQSYLARRYRRRSATGSLMILIGLMIGGAFLSGMERRADDLGEPKADVEKGQIPEGDKQFIRFWGGYWIVVLLLVFLVLGFALTDAIATRKYWLLQYQQIREDHQTKLRRDLAVYRQQKEQNRGGISGNRVGDPEDDT